MRFIIISLIVVGCEIKQPEEPTDPQLLKPHQLFCTVEEMKRVEEEANWCGEHTSYFNSYCYQSAMNRICKPRKGC